MNATLFRLSREKLVEKGRRLADAIDGHEGLMPVDHFPTMVHGLVGRRAVGRTANVIDSTGSVHTLLAVLDIRVQVTSEASRIVNAVLVRRPVYTQARQPHSIIDCPYATQYAYWYMYVAYMRTAILYAPVPHPRSI